MQVQAFVIQQQHLDSVWKLVGKILLEWEWKSAQCMKFRHCAVNMVDEASVNHAIEG